MNFEPVSHDAVTCHALPSDCVEFKNDETSNANDNVKNQDPEKHQHEAQHEHVNVRVVVIVFLVLVLSSLSHSFLAHIAWLKMSECLSHLIHA